MKILHVIQSMDKLYGGPSTVSAETVHYLNDFGHHAEILSTFSNNEVIDYSFIKKHVTLLSRKKFFFKNYSPLLKKWLDENLFKYDILHLHGIFEYPSYISMVCAREKKIPYIITPHGSLSSYDLKKKNLTFIRLR